MRTSSLTNTTPVPRGAMEWDDPSESLTRKMSAADFAGLLNTHANEPGLYCDGSAQSNRLIATLPSTCNLGTDPRGFFFKFRLPANAPSSTTVLWYWGGANNGVGGNSFACLINSSGALLFRLYGTNATDYRETTVTSVLSTYRATREICVQFGADSAGRDCRINGLDIELTMDTTVNTNSTAPSDWAATITSTYFVWEGSIGIVFKNFWPVNFRPALNDVQDSFFLGGNVSQTYRWATNTLSGDSIDFTGGTVGAWQANQSGTTISVVSGQLRVAFDGSNANPGGILPGFSGSPWSFRAGRRYNITVTHTLVSGTSAGLRLGGYANNGGDPFSISTNFTPTNTRTKSSWAANTVSHDENAAGFSRQVAAVETATYDLDNIQITSIGAFFFLSPHSFSDTSGYQLHDIGPYQVDALLPSSGWKWTHPAQRSYIRGQTSTNGNQQLCGTTILPPNSQITRIRAKSASGTPAITLGTTSGGTQLVASTSLSTSWKDLPIVLAGGINAAANSVWVGSNTSDPVSIHITYEMLS